MSKEFTLLIKTINKIFLILCANLIIDSDPKFNIRRGGGGRGKLT